jgi:glycosyltransferase involved in cell wall biosynthesis
LKKVLIITYYWPPSGGPGVQRSLKFVKYLPESGIEPIVLTVDPGSASYPLHDSSLLGDVAPQTRVIRTKSFEALKILSAVTSKKNIPHGGFANRGRESIFQKTLRFIRGNFFIPDARVGWVKYAVREASSVIEKEKIESVFISSPPHSSQLIGLELKKKFPALHWVADLRDPWTDIYYYNDLYHTKSAAAKDAAYELQVLKSADHVISVSTPICKMLHEKSLQLSKEKFHAIPNGFDESDFKPGIKPAPGKFIITYVGTMAVSYKPALFFHCLKKLEHETGAKEILIRMVGTHAATVRETIEANGLAGITEYIDHVDHAMAVEYMQQSDALLLVIPDVPNNEGILTGKLFEYLGSKRPVIALGPVKGEAAAILNECEAGKMFERDQENELFAFMQSLYSKWKQGEEMVNKSQMYLKYSRKELTRQLASYL